jgi:DNA-binding MarR family transcriptional regulator
MSPSIHTLAESLRSVVGEFVRATRDKAGTPSSAQSETLGVLGRQGPMSIAGLAEHRRVKHQSMRVVVAQLESEALVMRSASPTDRRSQLVALTAAGLARVQAARDARNQQIEMALATALSAQERQQLAEAIPLIQRMLVAYAN